MQIQNNNTAVSALIPFRGIESNSNKTSSAKQTSAEQSPEKNENTIFTPAQKVEEINPGQKLALNLAEQKIVQNLKVRDREVRSHEAAHLAAAGPYATGGASFSYQRGPDGRQYAVGGEVGIDTSAIANDPEATIRKAQTIQAAANAPAEPSSQDKRVAAQAAALETSARQALVALKSEEREAVDQSDKSGKTEDVDTESAIDASSETDQNLFGTQGTASNTEARQKAYAFPGRNKTIGSRLDLML